jgi:hypothetical protein
LIFGTVALVFLLLAGEVLAGSQPLANDNYLAPTPVNTPGTPLGPKWASTGNTIGATIQPNIFSPCTLNVCQNGPTEVTTCSSVSYANTVWYAFYPDHDGQIEIRTSGFHNVIALYSYDPTTLLPTLVKCEPGSSTSRSNDLFAYVQRGVDYEFQIGGRDGDMGSFDVLFNYTYRSNLTVAPFDTSPSLRFAGHSRVVRLTQLRFFGIAPGEQVAFACSGCGQRLSGQQVTHGKVVVVQATPAPTVGSTIRLVVAVTAPGQVGRYKIYIWHSPWTRTWAVLARGCLAPGVTTVSPAAAADPSLLDTDACPTSAPLNPAGAEYVFWKGAQRGLWEEWWSGTDWIPAGELTKHVLESGPAVTVHPGGEPDVFWRGTNGHLMESYFAGQWIGPIDLKGGPLASAPSVGVDATTGNEYVFWQGADNRLWEKIQSNGSWNQPFPVNAGALGSAPAVAVHPGGQMDVFYKGLNRDLWEVRYTTHWNQAFDLHDGPLDSAPSVGIDAAGDEYVFWRGIGGDLLEKTFSNGVWTAAVPVTNAGTLGSPPAVAVHASGEVDVFWRSPKGDLREMYDIAGQWIGPVDLGARQHLGLAGPAAGVDPAGT